MQTIHTNKAFPCFWTHSYRYDLLTATFAPSSDSIYLVPFEADENLSLSASGLKFKFDYVATGTGWQFEFRTGIYKLQRGTGGSANTLVKVVDLGTITRGVGDPATGTEYKLENITTAGRQHLPDGIYYLAFQWDDISVGTIPPSSVAFTAYGTTFPVKGGWVYYAGGTNAGSLPATIATLGAATTFQIYFSATY